MVKYIGDREDGRRTCLRENRGAASIRICPEPPEELEEANQTHERFTLLPLPFVLF